MGTKRHHDIGFIAIAILKLVKAGVDQLEATLGTVSYTHLTLPTTPYV